ncbi:SpoIIE family protein phosphatase [Streptomyces sp. NBC_00525]|uniref:SpoIIE family protein phosphatase n=1 Tax=Streptomyces sp. NBC_00525 TaxID=2903660 RepID=UPI002E800158|nr:SpoIIE family protein phosphatase [Streptomyces sp. NBC_00525]WUC92384.1 SpoIIE family protein phosphatase [Streptomyces sp. NBC_00525]
MSDTGATAPGADTGGEMAQALLETLFRQSAVGLHVLDTELRVVRVNALSEKVDPDRILGLHFTEAYRLDDPGQAERLLREVLRTGEPVLNRAARGRLALAPGPSRSLDVTLHRLDGAHGRPLGVLAAVVDVDETEKAHLRADVLSAVRRGAGHSLDVAATCEGLVAALVPAFADLAVVEVVDEVLRGADPPLSPLRRDVPLRRAAVRGTGTAPDNLVGELRRLPESTPFALAVTDLRPRLVELGPDTPWLDADPPTRGMIEAIGARSLIVVPLKLHGSVLGLVSLYRHGGDHYDERDLALAVTAAAHTALSIENALRYAREHVIASTVQRRLLPQHDGAHVAIETAHVLLPGRNSGCWFDTIGLSGARTALIIGNVAGHGLQTAITMGQLRTVIQALAGLDLEPDEVLARLNDTADRLVDERRSLPPGDALHRQPLTATCLYAVYDPFTQVCTVARAGHPAPVAVGPDGTPLTLDVPEGPALFSDDSAPFATGSVRLAEGSVLAFLTDALLPEAESVERVREALAFPERRLRELCDAIVYNLPAEADPDGAALLIARTGVVPADRVATWELAHDRTTPSVARTLVRDRLEGWDLDEDTIEATELIVSELITNAVRYGTPPVRLRVLLDRTLTCEVHDTSPVAPHLRHARTVDEGGRGLFIVSQLANHWGTRYSTDGKALWTEQEIPDEHA